MKSDPEGVKELRNCICLFIQGISGDHSFFVSLSHCTSTLMQHPQHFNELKRKRVRSCFFGHVGRLLRGNSQHKTPWRQNQFLSMRVCLGLLRFSNSFRGSNSSNFKNVFNQLHSAEANNRSSGSHLGFTRYLSFESGSISFMNVIIEEDKNVIAIYPIFLFYMFIDWFLIFI